MPWTFYTVFVGTVGSFIAYGYLAINKHDHKKPRALSELTAAEHNLLIRFRWAVLGFSTLLAVTAYWFIAPRNSYGVA